MKPATNSNAPAAIRPYASAILDPSKEQSDALRQTQRVFKNQQQSFRGGGRPSVQYGPDGATQNSARP